MKILEHIMILFLLLLLPTYSYPSTLGSLRISLIEGDVQIRMEDTGEWVPASANMPLAEGDQIWVPEGGRTEFQLKDGTFLRLDEESALEILVLEDNSSQFYLTEGYAYANFRGLKGSLLQIDTPISSIRAYEKSNFRIDAGREGYTDISVYIGSVHAENREGVMRVDAGRTLSFGEGAYAKLSPLGPPDPWERWNTDRDRKAIAQRPPSRYLPNELAVYSSDFEENGKWVSVREYGYVWRPTVVVSTGWAPYRVGRWVWIRGDYVWVSYEPWGWVPYHYGRWAYVASIGWCWVPPARGAVYWGPGFVGWVRTPTYVSWVPLAPREIYYGYGYYGPHSVNITRVNIKQIDTRKVVYKNVHVHNAVTIVHHDTFVKGKHVEVKIRENPFLKEKISIGRPNIKPEKATVMPMIKEISQTKRPPEPIREIKVKELKKKRPLVREKEASVLKPESPPKKMPVKSIEKRGMERPKESKPTEKVIEKPREFKPSERGIEKTKPAEKGIEKPGPVEKGVEKPKEIKPAQRGVEKPKEVKPPEKGVEKPREMRAPERGVEKPGPIEKGIERPKEVKPTEKEVSRPRETRLPEKPGPVEKGVEKPKEFKPSERGVDKPKEVKPPEKGVVKPTPIEKQIEKTKESKPPERGVEKARESKPPEGGAKPPEFKPAEKGVEKKGPAEMGGEKPKEFKPAQRGVEKPKESKPTEKGIEKPREGKLPEVEVEEKGERRQLERGVQRQREPKEIERDKGKP
jgi:hypothetical protein